MQTVARMALATAAFAAVHSALASRGAKSAAARMVGTENRDAAYRLFYVGQSLLGFAALVAYGGGLPRRTLYKLHGLPAAAARAGQLAGVLYLFAGLGQLGLKRWAGLDNLQARRAGQPMPRGPVAQGPETMDDGRLRLPSLFRTSRHPLNFSGIPIFWLTPHMTTRRLAFNAVGSAYLVLGSLHEEARLRQAYGDAYEAYRRSGVPFFRPELPSLRSAVRKLLFR